MPRKRKKVREIEISRATDTYHLFQNYGLALLLGKRGDVKRSSDLSSQAPPVSSFAGIWGWDARHGS